MAIRIAVPPSLYDALKAEGFILPDKCSDIQLDMPVDGIWQMHYRVNLMPDDVVKIGKAFVKIGQPITARAIEFGNKGDSTDGLDL